MVVVLVQVDSLSVDFVIILDQFSDQSGFTTNHYYDSVDEDGIHTLLTTNKIVARMTMATSR